MLFIYLESSCKLIYELLLQFLQKKVQGSFKGGRGVQKYNIFKKLPIFSELHY